MKSYLPFVLFLLLVLWAYRAHERKAAECNARPWTESCQEFYAWERADENHEP